MARSSLGEWLYDRRVGITKIALVLAYCGQLLCFSAAAANYFALSKVVLLRIPDPKKEAGNAQ